MRRALRNLRKKGLVYATKYPRRVYYQQPGKKPNTGYCRRSNAVCRPSPRIRRLVNLRSPRRRRSRSARIRSADVAMVVFPSPRRMVHTNRPQGVKCCAPCRAASVLPASSFTRASGNSPMDQAVTTKKRASNRARNRTPAIAADRMRSADHRREFGGSSIFEVRGAGAPAAPTFARPMSPWWSSLRREGWCTQTVPKA